MCSIFGKQGGCGADIFGEAAGAAGGQWSDPAAACRGFGYIPDHVCPVWAGSKRDAHPSFDYDMQVLQCVGGLFFGYCSGSPAQAESGPAGNAIKRPWCDPVSGASWSFFWSLGLSCVIRFIAPIDATQKTWCHCYRFQFASFESEYYIYYIMYHGAGGGEAAAMHTASKAGKVRCLLWACWQKKGVVGRGISEPLNNCAILQQTCAVGEQKRLKIS